MENPGLKSWAEGRFAPAVFQTEDQRYWMSLFCPHDNQPKAPHPNKALAQDFNPGHSCAAAGLSRQQRKTPVRL